MVADRGVAQGLLSDGQSFTAGQLQRCLRRQDPGFDLSATIPSTLRVLSSDKRAKKPSETLFRAVAQLAQSRGASPDEVLHVGSNLGRDIAPAKKIGFRTALFAGDRNSLVATREQLKNPATRPDVLITELPQIVEVLG
jgi:putative hydrolase of the HAD superfamily